MLDVIRFFADWLSMKKETNRLSEDVDLFKTELFSLVLAWGHFLHERDFGVKELKDKIERYEGHHDINFEAHKKFLIISLRNGCVQVELERQEIELAKPLSEDLHNVGGICKRSYEIPVFKVKQGNKRLYYIADSPSCLKTFLQMQKCGLNITEETERAFYKRFAQWLNFLIKNDRECCDMIEVCCIDSENWSKSFVKREYVDLPTINCQPSRINYTGTGVVLANQFYFNYLLYVFPTLPERISIWGKKEGKNLTDKLFILIPSSGYVRMKLDEKIQEKDLHHVDKPSQVKLQIGLQYRKYKNTVYSIKGSRNNYYCLIEYATPVRQMYNMMLDHRLSGDSFTENIMRKEIQSFADTLKKLLEGHEKTDICEVIVFDDYKITELNSLLDECCEKHVQLKSRN